MPKIISVVVRLKVIFVNGFMKQWLQVDLGARYGHGHRVYGFSLISRLFNANGLGLLHLFRVFLAC